MRDAVQVAIGVIVRNGEVLLTQRLENDRFAGQWEFPGGKLEPSESPSDALHRELDEELGISVQILARLAPVIHDYGDFRVALHPFVTEITEGEPQPRQSTQIRWFPASVLPSLPFPEANSPLLSSLASIFRSLGLPQA